jgi:hypothetical protein
MNLNQIKYLEACRKAQDLSGIHECTKHVNAVVELNGDEPVIDGYTVSDWTDGSTVCSYTDGCRD